MRMKFILPIAAACGLLASASEVPSESPVPPKQDRVVKCGLGKAFHAGRRAELARRLESGVMVFRGLSVPRQNREFRQDKTFWYLTGVKSRDAALVVDIDEGTEILFLPKATRSHSMTERWDGEIWDTEDEWVPELCGIADVRPSSELEDVLKELCGEGETLWISKHPYIDIQGSYDTANKYTNGIRGDDWDGRVPREEAFQQKLEELLPGVQVEDCRFELIRMRLHKTPEEQDAMRRASQIGALTMMEAMRSTEPGIGEWELDGLMGFIQTQHGATGPAYDAIVGSGANSLTLHYLASDRVLRPGEVVLIDFAPEVDHYVSDITRTWPTDGAWTDRMAELYDAVLESQRAGIAICKPGVTLSEVSSECDRVLRERGFGKLTRHGACHWIGMEVHDPDGTLRNEELGPGACFTIEPGLYEVETSIGIRIEDVVMITENGCEVLSRAVPKERSEISELMAEEGVLQRWQPARKQ